MVTTKIMSENESNIREAINTGISGEAVGATLDDVVTVSNSKQQVPVQVKNTVDAIVEMKNDVENKIDPNYASEYVRNNNEKISAALEEGITPKEVATTLIKSTEKSDSKKGKKHLKFIIRLISKMKNKELKLNKNKETVKEKGYQKVLTDK